MVESARPQKNRATPLTEPTSTTTAGMAASRGGPKHSNLIDELVEARKADFRTVKNLAEMAGVTPAAIKKLEAGNGPVATLLAVMESLPFQVTGLGPGLTFAEQLRNRRVKSGKTLERIAATASVSVRQIADLERGEGSVDALLRLLSVIAPKVTRRAMERACWGPGDKAQRDSRFTSPEFMQSIYDAFGPVNLDPCAHRASPVITRRGFYLSEGHDGLTRPWSGRLVFVNPPFSNLVPWLRRAHDEWAAGRVKTVVLLCPVRTDGALFQDTIKAAADIYFIRGRLRFGSEHGDPESNPNSLMLVIFGATAEQKARFADLVQGFWVFAGYPRVIAVTKNSAHDATLLPLWSIDRPFAVISCAVDAQRPARICCGPA